VLQGPDDPALVGPSVAGQVEEDRGAVVGLDDAVEVGLERSVGRRRESFVP